MMDQLSQVKKRKRKRKRKRKELNLIAKIPWLESYIPRIKSQPKVSQK
jgi:hypothetical protein